MALIELYRSGQWTSGSAGGMDGRRLDVSAASAWDAGRDLRLCVTFSQILVSYDDRLQKLVDLLKPYGLSTCSAPTPYRTRLLVHENATLQLCTGDVQPLESV